MFDPGGGKPLNAMQPPAGAPTRPMGRIPVIARLEWPDRITLVPARANRWTRTHVLIVWTPDESTPGVEQLVWLRATDVHRTLPG